MERSSKSYPKFEFAAIRTACHPSKQFDSWQFEVSKNRVLHEHNEIIIEEYFENNESEAVVVRQICTKIDVFEENARLLRSFNINYFMIQ